MSQISHHVSHTPNERCRPECLTPKLLCCGRDFVGMVWVHIALEGSITAHQHKAVLSDLLCPMMKHFYPDGGGLFQGHKAPIHSAHGVSVNIVPIICYGLPSHQTFTLDSTLTTIIKKPNEGIFWGKMAFHPSSGVPETCIINTTFLRHIMVLICHLSVHKLLLLKTPP